MKTYSLTVYLSPAILALITACALLPSERTVAPAVAEGSKVTQAAQAFTADLFKTEQPAITTAVAHLPPETQALAQAAYAALQRGIDAALAKGVSDLSKTDKVKAQAALVALGEATDKLSTALHAVGDPVLTSEPDAPALLLPGASVTPTVTVP